MKPIISLIILVLACCFFLIRGTNGNLLTNESFEQSKNGIMPDDWNGDNSVYGLSNDSFSGNHSLKYTNPDSTVYKVCSQKLNIKPGLNYSAGVKIKTSNIRGNDFGASFCVEWTDDRGKWIGGVYPDGIKGSNNWTDVDAIISIPDNANQVRFCCYVRKGMTGTAWFDDAFIKSYMTGKIDVMLLQPVYRGLLFEDENQSIILKVNLKNININAEGFAISTILDDSSGRDLIKNVTPLTPDKKDYIIKLNPSGIPTGSYTLNLSLTDKNKSTADSWSTLIRKISREKEPAVRFDDIKILIVNKKKVFPLGMYWSSINEADLKIYAQSKFNFLLPYSQPTDEQMKLAAKYNLKVVYSVKDFYLGSKYAPPEIKSTADETNLLAKTVEHYKDYPSLLGWYNNDEYPPEYIGRLNTHYSRITSEDPDHPVLSIIVNPSGTNLYLNSTDVIGSDPYVIPNSQLFKVGEAAKTVSQLTEYSRPVWMVIQAHNIGNYDNLLSVLKNYRTPTYDEMLSMSWQAIIGGATGLIYYSYFDLKRNPDVTFDTQWSNLKRIVAGIDTFSNVLLSSEKADSIQIYPIGGDNTWFGWTTRNYRDQLYIFVVDNGTGEGQLEFTIPGKYKSVQRLSVNPGMFVLNNSKFIDTIKKMEVKIYKAE